MSLEEIDIVLWLESVWKRNCEAMVIHECLGLYHLPAVKPMVCITPPNENW